VKKRIIAALEKGSASEIAAKTSERGKLRVFAHEIKKGSVVERGWGRKTEGATVETTSHCLGATQI